MSTAPTPEELNAYVAANVRRLRERAGLSQEKLAERADLHFTYLQRVERGTANPSVRVLAQLAGALGVQPGRLLRKAAPVERKLGRPKSSDR